MDETRQNTLNEVSDYILRIAAEVRGDGTSVLRIQMAALYTDLAQSVRGLK